MKPLSKKRKKSLLLLFIVVASIVRATAITLIIGFSVNAYLVAEGKKYPVVPDHRNEPKMLLNLDTQMNQHMFGNLRNYFINQNNLNLLPLKKISSINSNAFVGVSKNDLEQIQNVVMPEHEINLGIDSLNKKNALNYLPNLQNIYISKNQNPSQYKEIGFSDKIKFWN